MTRAYHIEHRVVGLLQLVHRYGFTGSPSALSMVSHGLEQFAQLKYTVVDRYKLTLRQSLRPVSRALGLFVLTWFICRIDASEQCKMSSFAT
jgi:hypothetical protein